jgi:hypothetical protein
MANQRIAEFLQRLPKGAPARVSTAISTAFEIVETAKEKVAAVLADGRLSRTGRDAKIAELMASGPNAHMQQLRAEIERDLAGINSEREGMRRRVVEANAFSESRKTEVRQWLRGLKDQERVDLAYSSKDPLIIESICTAPHFLSGVQTAHHEALIERVIESQNHARLGILLIEETAFEEAAAAIRVAEMDIEREVQPMSLLRVLV